MKLNNDKKVRLLRSCAQVKIIELTEKIMKLNESQNALLNNNPDLFSFVSRLYMDEKTNADIPTTSELIATPLPSLQSYAESLLTKTETKDFKNNDHDVEKVFETNLRTYSYENSLLHGYIEALDEYRTLVDKTYGTPININDVKEFMNAEHTNSFSRFAKGIKTHTPIHLASSYGKLADTIAERNDIAGKEYSSKVGRVFKAERPKINLDREFKGRLQSAGIKLVAGATLAALLTAGAVFMTKDETKDIAGIQNPKQGVTVLSPVEIQTPEQASTEQTPEPTSKPEQEQVQENQIFTNSIKDMETYEQACTDYFEKISDIYRYNTGNEIDLSSYGQDQIGYNSAARIILVELNGETFTFSGQGDTAPNYRYLKEALEATGANIEETSSSLSCIIDKNDPDRSIAIVDSLGNPVRSGKVLTGSNNAYNSTYVNAGRKILEEQGIENPSEAQCVGAYLLSDAHNLDPELSKALGEVQNLTRFIKSTFYYRDDKSDPYTVYLYSQKSQNFASDFESRVTNKGISTVEFNAPEYDER